MSVPPRWPAIAVLIAFGIASGSGQAADAPVSDAEMPAVDKPRAEAHTEFFPLPLYATSPNEGSTYGALPVFMRVDGTGRTTQIFAPSVSWNSAARINGTIRYYYFPSLQRRWTFIIAASTNVNRSFRLEYRDAPGEPGRYTIDVQALARRNLFYRFFGFGPNTAESDQSSYTRELALLSARVGRNVLPHLNLGVRGGVRWDRAQEGAVFDLPPTQELYPDTPGLTGAALATAELSARFDTRVDGDYDVKGVASELHVARDFGFAGGVSLWRLTWHTRLLVRETSFLTGAAHLYWTDGLGGGNNVPFFYRSALGGDTLFRGFPDDRFIDRGAWQAEAEQRFKLFTTNWFRVRADWRVDPFVGVGQVYPKFADIASRVRVAAGIGLRAFVHPNILGRVDVAYSSDGLVAYVLLGYPY